MTADEQSSEMENRDSGPDHRVSDREDGVGTRWWSGAEDVPIEYRETANGEISLFLNTVESVRPDDPAEAARLLLAFACVRPTKDLLELEPPSGNTGVFSQFDALAVLASAALTRDVAGPDGAAQLAIGRWRRESREPGSGTPLTDGIIHDVTAQRTLPEVAKFIRECRRASEPELIGKALRQFAGAGSSRTNIDKALLYIILHDMETHGGGAGIDSAELLRIALTEPSGGETGTGGIVAALNYLIPHGEIVEKYISENFREETQQQEKVEFVARLLVDDPEGSRPLADYAVTKWEPEDFLKLGSLLIEKHKNINCYGMVRDAIAVNEHDRTKLAGIMRLWEQDEVLSGRLEELLAAVINKRSGSGDVGSLPLLLNTIRIMSPSCGRKFRRIMAEEIENWSGREVVRLLNEIGPAEDLVRAVRTVNERFRESLLREDIDKNIDKFVEYLKALRESGRLSGLTFWALRELSDPSASSGRLDLPDDAIVANVAIKLYAADNGRDNLWADLLERFLENEQEVSADLAVKVIQRVEEHGRPIHGCEAWRSLLGATIGRWTAETKRQKVIDMLDDQRYEIDRDAITRYSI